jgi:hypothetical protein
MRLYRKMGNFLKLRNAPFQNLRSSIGKNEKFIWHGFCNCLLMQYLQRNLSKVHICEAGGSRLFFLEYDLYLL